MKSSDTLLAMVEKFEGLELNAYKCPAGVWTIGLGSTLYADGSKVQEGHKCSQQGAYSLFYHTIKKYEDAVNRLVTAPINQNQFDALVDFCYNLGEGNLAKSTLLKKVNANPKDPTIRAEFMKWNRAGGKVLNGLTKRREAEANLYFSVA